MSNSSHAGAKEQHRSCGESLMTYLVTYTYIIFFSTLPTAAAPHRCLTFGQKWRSIEIYLCIMHGVEYIECHLDHRNGRFKH